MSAVRITKRTGTIKRVKSNARPVLELELADNERVVSVTLDPIPDWSGERKTTDWTWTAYVEEALAW
jgi:hypothetical protein